MRIELGGGGRPRGGGWVNVDTVPTADVRHNLNLRPWPFADDSVWEVYSSHCLEHLFSPHAVLDEVARVCMVGAPVEIRTPHPHSHLAMVAGHRHVFSPVQAVNVEEYFPQDFWKGPKRLKLLRIEYAPTFMLAQARAELPFLDGLDDETVMRWVPGTCHECRYFYEVVANEHAQA